MSVLRRAFESRSFAPLDIPASSGKWNEGMVWSAYNQPASAVSTEQAMRLSAVFACLRLLSEAVSTLPLDTYRRLEGVRQTFPRPDYLTFAPPQGNRIDYLSQVMLSLLTDGNAFVLTPRDNLGVPVDLIVLDPAKVEIVHHQNGATSYRVNDKRLRQSDLMHIKGMSLPGTDRGVSPIGYARETVALGLAAQRFGSSFFDNGALPGAVIETPHDMTKEAAERFSESWHARHSGVGSANRVGVLTNGAKLNKVSIQPNDAQFLETRQFQVPDVARIFGVPPHLIADASNSTSWGSGLAEQNLAFAQFSLRPWIDRIEESHNRLLATHGLTDVFVKLNLDALLRASLKDRYEAAAVGIRNKFLLPNEVRSLEDMPPLDGGDDFPTLPGEGGEL